jgi:hypothetical protein
MYGLQLADKLHGLQKQTKFLETYTTEQEGQGKAYLLALNILLLILCINHALRHHKESRLSETTSEIR